jgi:selenoprotein W-related protein
LELVPGGGGCFEIDLDGKRVYSKLKTGSFPEEEAIEEMISARLQKG